MKIGRHAIMSSTLSLCAVFWEQGPWILWNGEGSNDNHWQKIIMSSRVLTREILDPTTTPPMITRSKDEYLAGRKRGLEY